MKSDSERGEFGAWLRRERLARFANVREAVSAMKRDRGYSITHSEWAEFEAGTRRPSAERRTALEAFLGGAAPVTPPEVDRGEAVLLAIERQTEMLEKQWAATTALVGHLGDLVAEMRAARQDRGAADETFAKGLARIEARLDIAGTPASTEAEDPPRNRSARQGQPVANGGR